MLERTSWIRSHLRHFIKNALPGRRIAFFKLLLVPNGLRLDVVDRHRSALAIVQAQKLVMSLLMIGHAELLSQINRVVNTAVHSHSTDGIIQVGRVTDEQQTAFPKPLGNPLMNAIDREIANLVGTVLGKKPLQRALDAVSPQYIFVAFVYRRGIHD